MQKWCNTLFDHVSNTFPLHNFVIQIRWLIHDACCRTIVKGFETIILDLFKNTKSAVGRQSSTIYIRLFGLIGGRNYHLHKYTAAVVYSNLFKRLNLLWTRMAISNNVDFCYLHRSVFWLKSPEFEKLLSDYLSLFISAEQAVLYALKHYKNT